MPDERTQAIIDTFFSRLVRHFKLTSGDMSPEDTIELENIIYRFIKNNKGGK